MLLPSDNISVLYMTCTQCLNWSYDRVESPHHAQIDAGTTMQQMIACTDRNKARPWRHVRTRAPLQLLPNIPLHHHFQTCLMPPSQMAIEAMTSFHVLRPAEAARHAAPRRVFLLTSHPG